MSTERGSLLYQTGRYDMAEKEYRAALGQDPDDALAHAMLGMCLCRLKEYDQATSEVRESIRLRPDWHVGYAVMADVLSERNRPKEAAAAISQAIAIDPFNPTYHGREGAIYLMLRKWKNALQSANRGLEIAPDDALCLNTRAQALTMVGDYDAARVTIGGALQKNPENAHSHASQGWTLLHAGDHRQALVHFREALRLNPELQWAKAGLVEAMKARNVVYRVMLGYFLWMSRLDRRMQWGVIIAGYVGYQVVRSITQAHPASAVFLHPIMFAYIGIVLLTWLAQPLFDLWLRLDRFGRYALSGDQRRGAELVGVLLLIPIGLGIAWILTGVSGYGLCALLALPLLVTGSAIFRCAAGWPRFAMAGYALLLTGVYAVCAATLVPWPGVRNLPGDVGVSIFTVYLVGIVASGWIANALMMMQVRM